MYRLRLAVASLPLGFASFAAGLGVGERVDNFELLDQRGQAHELHYLADASAVVLMAHTLACPSFAADLAAFETAAASFRERGVAFLMVNSDAGATRDDLGGHGSCRS